jgi:hypothetical protein
MNENINTSLIIKFYEKQSKDNNGRSLDEMQHYNYEKLENIHDYIQWMFPLRRKSDFNDNAPILTQNDITYIKNSKEIKKNMAKSLSVITDFWGIEKDEKTNKYIIKDDRINTWITPGNHNFLRVSRVIKSLILFDMEEEAKLFFNCLEELNSKYKNIIRSSFKYWKKSIGQ